jgi:uncharacterized protein (DUF58 family)
VSGGRRRGELTWRPRTFLFLGVGAALLVLAVALRDPVPLFLGLALLVAPAAAALSSPRRDPSVRFVWGEEGEGGTVRVAGAITPEPGTSPEDLVVDVRRPPSLRERSPTVARPGSGAVDLRCDWEAAEPTIAVVPPPAVSWRDPAGFVERGVRGVEGELVVVRYPPELARLEAMHFDRTTVLPGETRSRRLGESGEFFGLRLAAPTDPPRQINWKASARAGRLLANEYALERTGDAVLILDARATPLGAEIDERLLSLGRAATQGLAEALLRTKARVGVGVFGEFLETVPLAMGRMHRLRIRAALAAARLSRTAGPAERCAIAMRRFFPPGVTVILVSSLAGGAADSLVPYLRHRGFPLLVLSPSPLAFLRAAVPLDPTDDALANRLLALDRRVEVARAWDDAPVVDWSEFGSLGAFVEFVRRPAHRRVV